MPYLPGNSHKPTQFNWELGCQLSAGREQSKTCL